MKEALLKYAQTILRGTRNATSSPASADGATRSDSQAGQMTNPFGREAVPASHSAQSAKDAEPQTSATSGPSSPDLSPSARLQQSLANRLRARLDANGSSEYALTWKEWDMPSGPPICALRASAHRTSDNGFTGWPTPRAVDGEKNSRTAEGAMREMERGKLSCVPGVATLAGWPTTTASA